LLARTTWRSSGCTNCGRDHACFTHYCKVAAVGVSKWPNACIFVPCCCCCLTRTVFIQQRIARHFFSSSRSATTF
jgi:hypothetical protein